MAALLRQCCDCFVLPTVAAADAPDVFWSAYVERQSSTPQREIPDEKTGDEAARRAFGVRNHWPPPASDAILRFAAAQNVST